MTLQRKRRRSRLIIITGVLMSLVVGATIFMLLQAGAYSPTASEGPVMTDVVVAARDIEGRKLIEEGDLAVTSVPADQTNAGAFTSMADVVGRVSAVRVPAGQVMFPHLLASTDPNEEFDPGMGFDPDGPPVRAVSVQVPDDRAVAGTIQPGQRVDIVTTIPITPPAEAPADGEAAVPSVLTSGPSTKVTLQNVTVLSRAGDIYILHVELGMAEHIAEMTAAGGIFTLVLRPDQDARTATTAGSTLDDLIDLYGFPIPRQPDVDESSATTTQP